MLHFIVDTQAIATKSSNCDRSPQTEIEEYIEQQSESIAPSSLQKLRPEIRNVIATAANDFLDVAQMLLEQAFDIGRRLQEKKRLHGKGKHKYEWQIYLGQIGWSTIKANKYIKLVQIFGDMGVALLKKVELSTLFSLCRSACAAIVEKMRDTANVTEAMVQQWIKESRPKKQPAPRQEPITGWKPMPSGGGRYYNVFLHDEQTGISIEKQAKVANLLPEQVIKEAIALREKQTANSAEKQFWAEYDSSALKQCQTWQEVETAIECDRGRFVKVLESWTNGERERFVPMLATHLDLCPQALRSLTWIPTKLLLAALLNSKILAIP